MTSTRSNSRIQGMPLCTCLPHPAYHDHTWKFRSIRLSSLQKHVWRRLNHLHSPTQYLGKGQQILLLS